MSPRRLRNGDSPARALRTTEGAADERLMDVVNPVTRLGPHLDPEVMPTYRRVTAPRGADQGWAEQEMVFRKTVDLLEVRQVDLRVTSAWLPPLEFRSTCVVAERPFFVSWLTAESSRVFEAAASWGWRGWSTTTGAGLFNPAAAATASAEADETTVVFARVSRTPLFAGRAIFKALAEHVSPRAADAVVEYVLHWRSEKEIAAVRSYLADLEEARAELARSGFRGFKNSVAGYCSACNRPLRDPESLWRGIGPECLSRVGWFATSFPALQHADVPPRLWRSGTPIRAWTSRLLHPTPEHGVSRCDAGSVAQQIVRTRLAAQRRPTSAS